MILSDLSFRQATRLWLSFMWRTFLLTMPLLVAVEITSWWLMPHLVPGEPLSNAQFVKFIHYGLLLWLPSTVIGFILQIQALRWTLRSAQGQD